MIFTYLAIFREANRQEKQLMMRHGNAMLMHRPSMQPSGECEPEYAHFTASGGEKVILSLPHLSCCFLTHTIIIIIRRGAEWFGLIENVDTA